jgi:hypothetical protein
MDAEEAADSASTSDVEARRQLPAAYLLGLELRDGQTQLRLTRRSAGEWHS